MAFDDIPRIYCFSLGDFHNFEKCFFDFLVRHHLQKRYELEEGNKNQAIGNLLDLVIKIIHRTKAYNQSLDYLLSNIFKAAENEIRQKVERAGPKSFYGATLPFLITENISEAKEIFKKYYQSRRGRFNQSVINEKFWECMLESPIPDGTGLKIWGGPDALEIGDDGVIEIVDYKFRGEQIDNHSYDLDLMPKVYTLLCAEELIKLGCNKVRVRIRLWHKPLDESLYEEFDLNIVSNLKDFFRHKIEKILSSTEISFCGRPFCKACNSDQKEAWLRELKTQFNFS